MLPRETLLPSSDPKNSIWALSEAWGVPLGENSEPSYSTLLYRAMARFDDLPEPEQERFFEPLLAAADKEPQPDAVRHCLLSAALSWSFAPLTRRLANEGRLSFPAARSETEGAPGGISDFLPEMGHSWSRVIFGASPRVEKEAAECGEILLSMGLDVVEKHSVFLAHACASGSADWALWALDRGARGDSQWKGANALWRFFSGGAGQSAWRGSEDGRLALQLADRLLAAGADPFAQKDGQPFLDFVFANRGKWLDFPEEQMYLAQKTLSRAMALDLPAAARICARHAGVEWLGEGRALAQAAVDAHSLRQAAGLDAAAPAAPARKNAPNRL